MDGSIGSNIYFLIMMVVMIVAMYFLMIRPENKRRKEADQMRAGLQVGDEITTVGGVVGTICAVKEDTVVIETGADRVRIEFTKSAVAGKGLHSTEENK